MCKKDEVLPNGMKPEYHRTLDVAIEQVLEYEAFGKKYYAVHGENKHILKVWMD